MAWFESTFVKDVGVREEFRFGVWTRATGEEIFSIPVSFSFLQPVAPD